MLLKTNKSIIFLFIISLTIFFLSSIGLFNSLSKDLHILLFNNLGYTVNQGYAFGPLWFFHLNSNLGAIASKEILLLMTIGISIILYITKHRNSLKNFLSEIIGGIILFLIIKYTFNENLGITDFLGANVEDSHFPSGHAFTAAILYLSLYFLSEKFSKNYKTKKFLRYYLSMIIFLVGISRILGGNHSLTEVLGGWSLGICWILLLQIIWKIENKTFNSKQNSIES